MSRYIEVTRETSALGAKYQPKQQMDWYLNPIIIAGKVSISNKDTKHSQISIYFLETAAGPNKVSHKNY